MNKDARIYVAGHRGMVGSAILRRLESRGYRNLLTRTRTELDLRRQEEVERFFQQERPEYVLLAAARVGGILANAARQADFLYDNLMIAANVIRASHATGVKKLLNLGSSCIYPRGAPQPLKEEYLLTGLLEPTNEGYAVAKIAAVKLCRYFNEQHGTDYISAMPCNLYGPNDNFDLETSHVLPALIRRFHEAKRDGRPAVTLWGDGTPRREFLYVDDLAAALVLLMERYGHEELGELINVGAGEDISIGELAGLVAEVVGYGGQILWDTTRPNGMPAKLMDSSRIRSMGWRPTVSLPAGIHRAYEWYLQAVSGA